MKIRGVQITRKYVTFSEEQEKDVFYITGFEKMTVDTDNGSWIITADEIISFIKERR